MRYCRKCGGRLIATPHVCEPEGLTAMRQNPFLSLLINDDGTFNTDAPLILGAGELVLDPHRGKV